VHNRLIAARLADCFVIKHTDALSGNLSEVQHNWPIAQRDQLIVQFAQMRKTYVVYTDGYTS